MSYTKTYIFGESTTVGYLLGTGDRFLLTLQFTIEDDGLPVTYLAENKGLRLARRGKTALNFDFDQYFLVPTEYEFVVADLDNELSDLLYDSADVNKVQKDFYVKMEIKYAGTANYITEFSGYNIVELLQYFPLEQTHYFTILPKTNILNETYLYPKNFDRGKWDPGDTKTTQPNNPLELVFNRVGNAIKWDWVYLQTLIEKIFQLISPTISISFYHDWLFYGYKPLNYSPYFIEKSDLPFGSLILDGNWIGSVFGGQCHSQINSIGDLLKQIAFEYGCMAGLISQEKAFFRQMFYFDEGNVEALGYISDEGLTKKYEFTKIDYADIANPFFKQDYGRLNRYVENEFSPRGFSPESLFNKLSGQNGLDRTIISVIDGKSFNSNVKAEITELPGEFYEVYGIKHSYLIFDTKEWATKSGYLSSARFNAEYNFILKNLLYNTQVHEFKVDGLNYDFMKGFYKDGYGCSKIGQEKDWDAELTTIKHIRVQTFANILNEDTPGVINETPVSFLSMRIVPGEVALSYTQVGSVAIPIAVMNEGEWLDGFYVQVDVAFPANQIAGFTVYDGSETLFTIDKVMGKFSTVIKPQSITKVKRYAAADTIYMAWTGTGVTPSAGQGSLIIKKMVKA